MTSRASRRPMKLGVTSSASRIAVSSARFHETRTSPSCRMPAPYERARERGPTRKGEFSQLYG